MEDEQQGLIQADEIELIRAIGSGSTSVVYLATYEGREVAVKEFTDLGNEAERLAIERELIVLSQVQHVNILYLHGMVITDESIRLVLEYCSGGSLFDLLHNCRDQALPWPQRVTILADTASAMNYLHGLQPPVMHRDLKSLNIMLAEPITEPMMTVQVRLADFGLARFQQQGPGRMTRQVGTMRWMAPEVLIDTEYNEKADVFSFAMVLYEVVCRHVPFEKYEYDSVARKLARGERPRFEDYMELEHVPEVLMSLATCCWATSPDDRPSFAEIVVTLHSDVIDGADGGGGGLEIAL